jgi:hypothetical protein
VPFTVSHVAAVLPLRSGRLRIEALPTVPLVVASMVPDLPTLLGVSRWRPVTHTLLAALTLDVLLTLVVAWLWSFGLRPLVAHVLPALATRWREPAASRIGWWYAAAATGALTHVLWDGVTHTDGLPAAVPALQGHARVFVILQLVSSVVGLAVLAWWCGRWWRANDPAEPVRPGVRWRSLAPTLVVMALVAVAWAALRGPDPDQLPQPGESVRAVLREALFAGLGGLAVSCIVLALGYRAAVGVHGRFVVSRRTSARAAVPSRAKWTRS